MSLPLWLLCNVAAKTFALQEEDETLVHEERWKMTLDGVGDWRRHAAMADVADQVRRRNAKAWPTFGERSAAGALPVLINPPSDSINLGGSLTPGRGYVHSKK